MKKTEQKNGFYFDCGEEAGTPMVCVTDGNYYAFQGESGVQITNTNPYGDNSLYKDSKQVEFSYDPKRVRKINEDFGPNTFEKITESLSKYLAVFMDTSQSTQFARAILTDQEVKECTDSIFSNPEFLALDLNTEAGKDKLYQLQYREFEKRDQTMDIPFSIDNPHWKPEDVKRNIKAKILKPVKFTDNHAEDFFGHWYEGEAGDTIMMSSQHFTYFNHQGCVEFANETTSGEAVTGVQMTYDGFVKCEDDSLWKLIIDHIDTCVITTDQKGNHHLFHRSSNDRFTYWKPLVKEGDVVVLPPGTNDKRDIEVEVKHTASKDGQQIILYAHQDEPLFSYVSEIKEIKKHS